MFAECLFPPACLGGINKLLVARHPEAAISFVHVKNMTCNTKLGFRNNSRLCHTCAAGYKRQGMFCIFPPDFVGCDFFILISIVFLTDSENIIFHPQNVL